MKIPKKLLVGLPVLLALAAVFFIGPQKAFAAVGPTDISSGKYTFQDGANIIGDFGASGEVSFVDVNTSDTTRNYVPDSSGGFCDPGDMPNQNGISGKIKFGINIDKNADLKASSVPAQIKLGYQQGAICKGVLLSKSISNPAAVGATDFQWDGANITSLSGTNNPLVFTPAPNTTKLYLSAANNSCGYDGAILLDNEGGNTGNYYVLEDVDTFGQNSNLDKYPPIKNYFDASKCRVKGVKPITITGTAGQAPADGSGSTSNKEESCQSSAGSGPFAWIICPVLGYADTAAGALNNFVEGQLNFCTGKSSTTGETCTDNNLTDQVKVGWGIIKNIATVLLVIVLLVAVISQAMGSQRIDAYTIRKMLPKVVAAVILIQLSWVLFKWLIDLSNDTGKGIQDLLFAPFGGPDNMSLAKMIGHSVVVATGSTVGANVFGVFAVLAAGGLALANIPGLLVMALFVVIALFTAFFVLVLRKVLILMLIILAPIALIAWILPGTERYWKMWQENFTKLLLMFPMIMALIAAGRIFAFIASGSSSSSNPSLAPGLAVAHLGPLPVPYVASVTGFADLAIVLIAFFGPYLLLPKTFQWGGAIMTAMSRASERGLGKLHEKAERPMREYGERWQGKQANKYNPEGSWRGRTLRRIQSGHAIPLSKRSQRLAIQAGDKWAGEQQEQASAYAGRVYNTALENGYTGMTKNRKTGKLESKTWNPGVEAAKQALVDLTENKDNRIARGAQRSLIDTSSWIEIQNNVTKSGKRVFETPSWNEALELSPEHYGKVSSARPDLAPHMMESYPVSDNPEVNQRNATLRTASAIRKLTAGNVPGLAQGFFEEIRDLKSPDLSEVLANQFEQFASAGVPGQQALGSLTAGELGKIVDGALAHYPEALTIKGYVQQSQARGRGEQPQAPAEETSTPRAEETSRPSPEASSSSAGTAAGDTYGLRSGVASGRAAGSEPPAGAQGAAPGAAAGIDYNAIREAMAAGVREGNRTSPGIQRTTFRAPAGARSVNTPYQGEIKINREGNTVPRPEEGRGPEGGPPPGP